MQSFAGQCWVVGQDPKNVNRYNVLLKFVDEVDFSKASILFSTPEITVSQSPGTQGKIGISTSKMSPQALSAFAAGSAEEAQLIDANLKVSIICRK